MHAHILWFLVFLGISCKFIIDIDFNLHFRSDVTIFFNKDCIYNL